MAQPSYKLARQERQKSGSATMEIEPSGSGGVKDLTQPEPHTETLMPPKKPGEVRTPGMSPVQPPDNMHADPGVVHSGDYSRPGFTGVSKT